MSPDPLELLLELNRAHAILTRRFDGELGGVHGLGLSDLALLHALAAAPDGRLRRVDLAARLGVTPSGVTWMLRPLVKRRLVTSEASEADARVSYAVLTAAGRRLLADALTSARHLAADVLGDAVGRTELGHAAALLSRIAGADPPLPARARSRNASR